MTATGPDRQDLYTGLVDVLGETRARTLMSYLPSQEPSALVTTTDLAALESRLDQRFDAIEGRFDLIEGRFDAIEGRLDGVDDRLAGAHRRIDGLDGGLAAVNGGLAGVNARLDRLFLTLVAGLFVIVAAMAGVMVSSLT